MDAIRSALNTFATRGIAHHAEGGVDTHRDAFLPSVRLLTGLIPRPFGFCGLDGDEIPPDVEPALAPAYSKPPTYSPPPAYSPPPPPASVEPAPPQPAAVLKSLSRDELVALRDDIEARLKQQAPPAVEIQDTAVVIGGVRIPKVDRSLG